MTLSDIHGNIENVRQLRRREPNGVDFIIVAGDIDYSIFPEFFRIMDSYECPVYVVYGNWDNDCHRAMNIDQPIEDLRDAR